MKRQFLMLMFLIALVMLKPIGAQEIIPDSIKSYLKNAVDLAWDLSNTNSDSAMLVVDEALALATEYNALEERAELIRTVGIIHFYRVDYAKALEYFFQSRDICLEIGYKPGAIKALSNISLIYNQQGMHQKSLDMDFDILQNWIELGNDYRIAQSYNNIAVSYMYIENYSEALQYYLKAVQISEQIDENDALDLYYNNVGSVYLEINKLDSAKVYFDKSLLFSNKAGNAQMRCNTLAYIGSYYLKLNQVDLAIKYLEQSFSIAQEIAIVYEIESVAADLQEAYRIKGDYKLAYEMLELQHQMADSANNLATVQKIAEKETAVKYEKEKEFHRLIQDKKDLESELKIRNQKLIRNFSLVLVFIFMLLLYYAYRNYRRKELLNRQLIIQRDEILAQKEEIEAQRDEIEELNNTKDKFFAIIAHDLKNPLGALYSLSQLMDQQFDSIEVSKMKKYVEQIHVSSKNTFDLLENLLHWAIVQTGSMKSNPTVFNIVLVIRESVDLLASVSKQKCLTIEMPACQDCIVNSDLEMITTVVRNLLQNAIKFSAVGSEIRFSIDKVEDFWKISVEDQGIGMSTEDQAFIFDLNYDKKKIGDSKDKGTGLGLILCKEFVELNGGVIWVESSLGQGSMFCFTLPISK